MAAGAAISAATVATGGVAGLVLTGAAGKIEELVNNPGCVQSFCKEVQKKLEEPGGLGQALTDTVKEIAAHKGLDKLWPDLEPIFAEMGLAYEQVEAFLLKLDLKQLKQAALHPLDTAEALVSKHILALLRPVLEPVMEQEPVFQELGLSWEAVEAVLKTIRAERMQEALREPGPFVQMLVQRHLPKLLRPVLEPAMQEEPAARELGLEWADIEGLLQTVGVDRLREASADPSGFVKELVQSGMTALAMRRIWPLLSAFAEHESLSLESLSPEIETLISEQGFTTVLELVADNPRNFFKLLRNRVGRLGEALIEQTREADARIDAQRVADADRTADAERALAAWRGSLAVGSCVKQAGGRVKEVSFGPVDGAGVCDVCGGNPAAGTGEGVGSDGSTDRSVDPSSEAISGGAQGGWVAPADQVEVGPQNFILSPGRPKGQIAAVRPADLPVADIRIGGASGASYDAAGCPRCGNRGAAGSMGSVKLQDAEGLEEAWPVAIESLTEPLAEEVDAFKAAQSAHRAAMAKQARARSLKKDTKDESRREGPEPASQSAPEDSEAPWLRYDMTEANWRSFNDELQELRLESYQHSFCQLGYRCMDDLYDLETEAEVEDCMHNVQDIDGKEMKRPDARRLLKAWRLRNGIQSAGEPGGVPGGVRPSSAPAEDTEERRVWRRDGRAYTRHEFEDNYRGEFDWQDEINRGHFELGDPAAPVNVCSVCGHEYGLPELLANLRGAELACSRCNAPESRVSSSTPSPGKSPRRRLRYDDTKSSSPNRVDSQRRRRPQTAPSSRRPAKAAVSKAGKEWQDWEEQERLLTVCPLCEEGGGGRLCVPHEREKMTGHMCKECDLTEPDARGRLEKTAWDLPTAIGDYYLDTFAEERAEQQRLKTACRECEVGASGSLCAAHQERRRERLSKRCPDCKAGGSGPFCAKHELARACPDCRPGGEGARCGEHAQRWLVAQCPDCEDGGGGPRCCEHEQQWLDSKCPQCQIGGMGRVCKMHRKERRAKGCPKCVKGGAGELCVRHAIEHERYLRAQCPRCVEGGKAPLCAKHVRLKVQSAVHANSFIDAAEEARMQAACPKCYIGGGGSLCDEHEQERLSTVCPACEDGGGGSLCNRHACPSCVVGAFGPLCADHARKKVQAAVTAMSFIDQTAKVAEEQRLLVACPKCESGGAGSLCHKHEQQRLSAVCPRCESGGFGSLCNRHACPECVSGAQGPLCAAHARSKVKKAVRAMSFIQHSAKLAARQKKMEEEAKSRSQLTVEESVAKAKQLATRTTETITRGVPSGSQPIVHPGGIVRVGVRSGPKGLQDPNISGTKNVPLMYDDTQLYRTVQLDQQSLAAIDPKAFDIIYDILPGQEYSPQERDAVLEFMGHGGRLVLVAEHNGFTPEENKRITKIIYTLGGAVVVRDDAISGEHNAFSAGARQINSLPLTSGIQSFTWDTWASLAISEDTEDLDIMMVDTGRGDAIAMVDFKLGRGNVTVFADGNPLDDARRVQNRAFFLNLAHDARHNTLRVAEHERR